LGSVGENKKGETSEPFIVKNQDLKQYNVSPNPGGNICLLPKIRDMLAIQFATFLFQRPPMRVLALFLQMGNNNCSLKFEL